MTDLIVTIIILLIIGASSFYIYKAKKRGEKCIGCPYAKECMKNRNECNKKSLY